MHLKKLELYGFKSFAERTQILFDQGITAIVGPNGSGKSNVSDAVRWVMGEQSAKSLRGGKMEDIIFGGTEKRRPLSYCEVTLTFDNGDGALPVDFAEVGITRRVFRSGESEYYINQSACRLKDIVDLFRDTGAGREGYSIVGQGRIDEILSNKAEDRRQVFEEAAGIARFKARKAEAARRLEHTAQNLVRIEDLLEELGRQVGPLERQSQDARRYLELQEQLKRLELNLFRVEHDRGQERLGQLAEQLAERSGQLEQTTAQRQQVQQRLEALDQALSALEGEQQTQQAEQLALAEQTQQTQGEMQLQAQQARHADEQAEQLDQADQAAREQIARLQRLEHDAGGRRAELDNQIAALQARQAAGQQDLAGRDARIAEEEAALAAEKDRMMAALNRLSDVRSSQARLEAMAAGLKGRQEQVSAARGEAAGRLSAAREELSALEGQALALDEQIQQCEAQHQRARQDRQTQQQAIDELTRQAQQRREALQAMDSRLSMLQAMKRDYEGFNQSVKRLMGDAAARPELGAHLLGVVADVIQVPQHLEKALEMVLGASLQHVIVPREEDAKALIEHLRRRGYGRATFLPLSAVRGRRLQGGELKALEMPGVVGLAADLVGSDARYRQIVDNLLGRTLVAEDMDHAIAIARRFRSTFRVVTLQGDLLNPGGSMTGGSTQSRYTSLLGRDRQIAQAKEQRAALAGQIAQDEADRSAAQAAYDRLNALSQQAREQGHQLQVERTRHAERQARMQAELARQAQQADQLRDEDEQLTESLADIERQLAAFADDHGALTRKQDVDREGVEQAQRALDAQRRERDAAQQTLSETGMALAAARKEREGLTDQAAHTREQAAYLQRQIDRNRQERQRLKAEGEQALAQERALAEQLAAQKEALLALSARQTQQAQRHREMLAQRREQEGLRDGLQSQFEQVSETLHRLELQHSKTETDLDILAGRIWEAYGCTYAGALEFAEEGFEPGPAQKRIDAIRREVRAMGTVNVNAIEDYLSTKTRFDELNGQHQDLVKARGDLEQIIGQLDETMERQFAEQFKLINQYFGETFTALFGGGTASVSLQDEDDLLGSGIEINAQPPGKKLQSLLLLSGGERALTAIALLFAMLKLRPSPFCILDEIDAALDESNVDTFARYLHNYAQSTQFVVVTHRKGTMEACNALYGITMQEKGISTLMSVRLSENPSPITATE